MAEPAAENAASKKTNEDTATETSTGSLSIQLQFLFVQLFLFSTTYHISYIFLRRQQWWIGPAHKGCEEINKCKSTCFARRWQTSRYGISY